LKKKPKSSFDYPIIFFDLLTNRFFVVRVNKSTLKKMGNNTTREVEVEEDDRHQTLKTKFVEEQLKQNLKKYELIIKNGKKKLEEKERLLKQQMNKVKSQENSMKLQNEEIQKLRKQLEDAQKEK